jgi:hypothetical protein
VKSFTGWPRCCSMKVMAQGRGHSFISRSSLYAGKERWAAFSTPIAAPGTTPSITKNLLAEDGEVSLELCPRLRQLQQSMSHNFRRRSIIRLPHVFPHQGSSKLRKPRHESFSSHVDGQAHVRVGAIMASQKNNITEFNVEVIERPRKLH